MKAVFDTKPTSAYDDKQAFHYHFPKRYLKFAEQAEGDWVVLRRPRADGGNLAYFAAAKTRTIQQDPDDSSMFYAYFGDYVQFEQPVPWRPNGQYAEEALRQIPQREVGVYLRGRSVRLISEEDFSAILDVGLDRSLRDLEATTDASAEPEEGDDYNPAAPARRTQKLLSNRLVRDRNFRELVCNAYGRRCAISGFNFVDRLGHIEVQAAHIWSVSEGGPDVIQNGIAMTATVHWLFDHHLISLTDDYRLLIADGEASEQHIFLSELAGRTINLPEKKGDWPYLGYLERHRAKFLELSK